MHIVSTAALATVVAALPLLVLLAVRGPVDGEGDPHEGWWGEKTATVNWCEADYVYTHYIAEFGNSLSSLAIVLNGLYGIYAHYGKLEARYYFAFGAFIVVGLGSFAFHATLRREFQLLDELPMVWGNGVFIYCVSCLKDKPNVGRPLLAITIAGIEFTMTLMVIFLDKEDQSVFICCYGAGVVYLMIQSYKLNGEFNARKDVLLMETSILLYVGGFFLWLVDRHFCKLSFGHGLHIRSLHLHSFWHLGAGMGTFSAVLFWIWTRNTFLKQPQAVRGRTPADRWIEFLEGGQSDGFEK